MSDTTNGDGNQNPGSGDQTPQTPPDPVEALRELALRIIQPAYIRFVTQPRPSGPPELLPGQLPPNPPIPLPVPEGSRIIGTMLQNGEPTTVLATPLSPDAALAFYRERMAALGWTHQQMPEYHQQHGDFTESTPRHPIQSMQFFVGPRGPSLRMTVTLDPEQGPLTEVHLAFDTTLPDPTQGPWRRHWNAFENMVPLLEPPAGAEQRFGGGGGGGGGGAPAPPFGPTLICLPSPLTMTHHSPRLAGSAAATASRPPSPGAPGPLRTKVASPGARSSSSSSIPKSSISISSICASSGPPVIHESVLAPRLRRRY